MQTGCFRRMSKKSAGFKGIGMLDERRIDLGGEFENGLSLENEKGFLAIIVCSLILVIFNVDERGDLKKRNDCSKTNSKLLVVVILPFNPESLFCLFEWSGKRTNGISKTISST